jgi:hypothetical protein
MNAPTHFFIFDVESVGLHGEGFAVAGGMYSSSGQKLKEFAYHCRPSEADGLPDDREWVAENVTFHPSSVEQMNPFMVRDRFWNEWMYAKSAFKAMMFVECGWPVEAAFMEACIKDHQETRNWDGPYPMHEIASVMLAAGMDPMATYGREESEKPAHEPLADARQSARLLFTALDRLSGETPSPQQ